MGYIIITVVLFTIILAARQLTLLNLNCPKCGSNKIEDLSSHELNSFLCCKECGTIF